MDSRAFPAGDGRSTAATRSTRGSVAQNAPGNFLRVLIRRDLLPSDNAHAVIARSLDSGVSFTKWYEVTRDVFQDRAMIDIDRPTTRGGATGPYDGKVLLCYDDFSEGGGTYAGSYLRVLDADGAMVSEVQMSGLGTPPFRGTQFQPVAGVNDGQFYLVSTRLADGGATRNATSTRRWMAAPT